MCLRLWCTELQSPALHMSLFQPQIITLLCVSQISPIHTASPPPGDKGQRAMMLSAGFLPHLGLYDKSSSQTIPVEANYQQTKGNTGSHPAA